MTRAIARISLAAITALPIGAAAREMPMPVTVQSQAQAQNDDLCADMRHDNYDNDRETACEVREFTLPRGAVSAETANGSVRVVGEDRGDIRVRAIVVAHARTRERANAILKEVTVTTNGTVIADGPRNHDSASWWVSFRIQSPKTTDVSARSSNGSLGVTGVSGRINLRTTNGGIRLMEVGGDVDAETTNGSVSVTLDGDTWQGAGLNATTTNGSVKLEVPERYNAHLITGTVNGRVSVDFPITVQGRLTRELETDLGSGGPTIRVKTSNGSVRVGRR